MTRSLLMLLVLITLTASSAVADGPRDITWDTLVPPAPPLEDPFAHLTADHRDDLERLAFLRQVQARGLISETSPERTELVELTSKLKSEGLDLGSLLAQHAAVQAEIERRNRAVVGDLGGQLVRLSGFALPLGSAESGVKEFLLAPYMGFCGYEAPPPNQMVFVRLAEEFRSDGRYAPVWVTGRMTVEEARRPLTLDDGEYDITTGYTLDGITIERSEN